MKEMQDAFAVDFLFIYIYLNIILNTSGSKLFLVLHLRYLKIRMKTISIITDTSVHFTKLTLLLRSWLITRFSSLFFSDFRLSLVMRDDY